jgi:hypothetical protein
LSVVIAGASHELQGFLDRRKDTPPDGLEGR